MARVGLCHLSETWQSWLKEGRKKADLHNEKDKCLGLMVVEEGGREDTTRKKNKSDKKIKLDDADGIEFPILEEGRGGEKGKQTRLLLFSGML